MDTREIMVTELVFSASTISGSGNITSNAVNLNRFKLPVSGFFSVEVVHAGAASVLTVEYLVSFDGTNFLTPSEASEIKTAKAVGRDIYSFEPVLAPYMQIKLTETAGNAVTSFSAKLAVN